MPTQLALYHVSHFHPPQDPQWLCVTPVETSLLSPEALAYLGL